MAPHHHQAPPARLDEQRVAGPGGRRRWPLLGAGLVALGAIGVGAWFALPALTDGSAEQTTADTGDFESTPDQTTSTNAPATSRAAPPTSASVPTEPPPTTAAAAAPPDTQAPSTANAEVQAVSCTTGGEALQGYVTGVEDWVTVRSGPSLSATDIDQVRRQAELVYFPDSVQQGVRFEWIEVSANGRCGWVASKFVKNVHGQVVGISNAVDYVHRALRGLEPEALHATFTYGDVNSSTKVDFDDSSLDGTLLELRDLYQRLGTVEAAPDEAFGDAEPNGDPACFFGDILHCRVILTNEAGAIIGYVELTYVGDGVTFATYQPR